MPGGGVGAISGNPITITPAVKPTEIGTPTAEVTKSALRMDVGETAAVMSARSAKGSVGIPAMNILDISL